MHNPPPLPHRAPPNAIRPALRVRTVPLPALALLALLFAASPAGAADGVPPQLAAARRVVFLGDSITYGGTYVDLIEAVLRLRAPGWHGEIRALGLPSETVSGLSEPGHAGGRFPRPVLRERLDRVLAQTKPDLVVACYGMNDGIYLPFSEDRFAAYQQGMLHLRSRVAAAGAQIIHVTPPVFDPVPIPERVLATGLPAGSKFYINYNDVLGRYAEWLLSRRGAGWEVIDVHGPMSRALSELRRTEPSFTFARDGVHPSPAGHAVIARAILSAWNLRPDDGELLGTLLANPQSELLTAIHTRRKLLSDAWLTATGHQRPGMAVGRPLDEAEREAAVLEQKIRTLTATWLKTSASSVRPPVKTP